MNEAGKINPEQNDLDFDFDEPGYKPPYDDELITGATTIDNRLEIVNILAQDGVESAMNFLNYLEGAYARTGEKKFFEMIMTMQDKVKTKQAELNLIDNAIEAYKTKNETFLFKNDKSRPIN